MYAGFMPVKTSMASADTKRFVANLRLVCSERGSIQEIAERADVARGYLSRVLHGKQVPSLDVASQIAEAAGLSLSEMVKEPAIFSKKHGKKFAAAS
ncbi:MAG: helix-turn-helix domain-containing protein [Planctomycetes bacterium]|nr:helix-turn-helix domain-containing protein [Planctomycetota bacterium]